MVIAVGSMLVKGVFKGGSLLTGLAKTVTGFKQTEKEGKSTGTEMKRMTGTTKKLAGALGLIGAGGFTALMMTAPQLSAALFRIKMQLRMIAWAVGRHLKPLLDSVGKILKAIRTGNMDMFIEGIKDAWNAIMGLVNTGWNWLKRVYNSIWDELGDHGIEKPGWVVWIENWILELERIITEKDWNALWDWAIAPFKVVWDLFLTTKVGGMVKSLLDEIVKEEATFISIGTFIWKGIWKGIMDGIKNLPKWAIGLFGRDEENKGWSNSPVFDELKEGRERKHLHETYLPYEEMGIEYEPWNPDADRDKYLEGKQIGGMIPTTGVYRMHAGENVIPKGSSGMSGEGNSGSHGNTSITLDFNGAHFDLAGGSAEIQSFAERVASYIAAAQQDVRY